VKKFELKLIQANSHNKEKSSIRASYKILENCLNGNDNRKIKSKQIGTILYLKYKYIYLPKNIEILVQELCKNLKS
jgi:hypothetical protein